jgi:cyclopropane fatty-acyl-phospholipid synthase-like methyltransferase
MSTASKLSDYTLRRWWWKLLHLAGLKELVWDSQYKSGLWRRPARSPLTIQKISELCAGGSLLEFGCGTGDLLGRLRRDICSRYAGYDVSHEAIKEALASVATDIEHTFQVGSMEDWDGYRRKFDLILVEESLYYLSKPAAIRFLHRCRDSLTDTGRIFVIMHDSKKHAKTTRLCRRACEVVREEYSGPRVFLTLR